MSGRNRVGRMAGGKKATWGIAAAITAQEAVFSSGVRWEFREAPPAQRSDGKAVMTHL